MRCQFCGWDNREGRTACAKCGNLLADAMDAASQRQRTAACDAARHPSGSRNALKTTAHEDEDASRQVQPIGRIPQTAAWRPTMVHPAEAAQAAGRQLSSTRISRQESVQTRVGQGSFFLTPISDYDGMPDGDPIELHAGEQVRLNGKLYRFNTPQTTEN